MRIKRMEVRTCLLFDQCQAWMISFVSQKLLFLYCCYWCYCCCCRHRTNVARLVLLGLAERLASLPTEHKRFVAQDSVHIDPDVPSPMVSYARENLHKNKFFDQCQVSKNLDLKVGAQVMLVQNISTEEELINGSRGVVERFRLVPVVKNFEGSEEQLLGPDDSDKYPGYAFEQLKFGMSFVFDNKTWKICKFVKYPSVRFLNNRTKIILPTTFERTLFHQGTCRRIQLPLRLSWALTIHKAQGCTLDWLICDLAGCFTAGQAYVALSRAKSMAGLQIRNFSTKAVLSNPLVDGFYQALTDNSMPDFLRNQAGLWWYPILDHPDWFEMFTKASSTARARANASQFRLWVANYKPSENYQGWKGYSNRTTSISPLANSPLPTKIPEKRTVTPTTYLQTTLTNHSK